MAEAREGANAQNDLSWYTRYPELSIAAASFPYPYRPGMKVPVNTLNNATASVAVPGVMVLDWYPTIGKADQPTDPAAVLGKEMYARVRAAYSGTLRADAPDYVVYVMALSSLFTYIAWLKRLYRALSAYNPTNYIIPDGILGAMGLSQADIQSLRTNKTQLWQLINELVHQSRKFTCPSSLDIMNRHYWMSDNVYLDDNSLNGQIYMFNLRGVYFYSEQKVMDPSGTLTDVDAAGLIIKELPWVRYKGASNENTVLTPTILYEFGREMIDRLVAWDESYTINGYLQRAYEGQPGFVVSEIMADEIISPVYEPEVLMQIENSAAVPMAGAARMDPYMIVRQIVATNALHHSNAIYVAKSDITTAEYTQYTNAGLLTVQPVLSIRSDNPSVGDNIVASRLNCIPTDFKEATLGYAFEWATGTNGLDPAYIVQVDAGTEIPVGWYIYDQLPPATAGEVMSNRFKCHFEQRTSLTPTTGGTMVRGNLIHAMLVLPSFDWHPKALLMWLPGASSGEGPSAYFVGDIHNLTSISREDLKNLHRICMFSEFNSFSMM